MNREEIRTLIGGYASGTLSEDERRRLMEAALDDQELFDTLQNEQALKELLDDPFSREAVRIAVTESLPKPRPSWFARPWVWGLSASALAAVATLAVLIERPSPQPPLRPMARSTAPAAVPPPPVAQAPVNAKSHLAVPAPSNAPLLKRRVVRSVPAPPPTPPTVAGLRQLGRVQGILSPAPAAPMPPDSLADKEKQEPTRTVEVQASTPTVPVQQTGGPQQFVQSQAPSVTVSESSAPPTNSRQSEESRQFAGASQSKPSVANKRADTAKDRDERAGSPKAVNRNTPVPGAAAGVAGFAAALAVSPPAFVSSFQRQLPDGSFVKLPADTVFHPGESFRIAILPRISGALTLWEQDAAHPVLRQIFPLEPAITVMVREGDPYTPPVDIVVEKGQRLRLVIASAPLEIVVPQQ